MKSPKRRAPAVKDTTTTKPKDQMKQRLNLHVKDESHKRLMIHCLMLGLQPGELVDSWIIEKCTAWNLPAERNTAAPVKPTDRPDLTGDVSPEAPQPTAP